MYDSKISNLPKKDKSVLSEKQDMKQREIFMFFGKHEQISIFC